MVKNYNSTTTWPRNFGLTSFELNIYDFLISCPLTVFLDWQRVTECMQHSAELLRQGAPNDAESALQVIAEGLLISSCSEKLLEMKAESLFMVCVSFTEPFTLSELHPISLFLCKLVSLLSCWGKLHYSFS